MQQKMMKYRFCIPLERQVIRKVSYSHIESILTVSTMISIEMTMNEHSRVLHMMPLSHSAPLHLFMGAALYTGATHVLAPTFTPDLLLQMVSQEKVTHFFGAPVAYLLSAKQPNINEFVYHPWNIGCTAAHHLDKMKSNS